MLSKTRKYFSKIFFCYYEFDYKSLKKLLKEHGKSRSQIAQESLEFVYGKRDGGKKTPIEFYAYYAAYHWVAFIWLFGTLNEKPKGFPWYCRDLKQMLDDKFPDGKCLKAVAELKEVAGVVIAEISPTIKLTKIDITDHPNYPRQENKHDCLGNAKWNKKLHEFQQTL